MKKIALFIGCATALVGLDANAEVGSDNFNPQITFRPNEFPWESGPIGGSAFSVNLTASAFHEVDIEMTGVGDYDFDAQSLTFIGDGDGGVMENALGVEVGVIVSVAIPGVITADFNVGLYNIEETANGTFSPYLLPGDPERPFGVSEAIGPNDLVETDFAIPGVNNSNVHLDIDWTLNIPAIEYRSTQIILTDGEDSVLANEIGIYANEEEALDLALPGAAPGETAEMFGTLHGTFDAEVSFVFTINATVQVNALEFNIGPIDIPLDYPVNENEPVEFPPEQLRYDVPELPPATSSGGADSSGGPPDDTSGGESDSDSQGEGTTGDPPSETTAVGDSSGGGIPADPTGDGDAGCGCSTGQQNNGLFWMVGMLGFALVRRRRDGAPTPR